MEYQSHCQKLNSLFFSLLLKRKAEKEEKLHNVCQERMQPSYKSFSNLIPFYQIVFENIRKCGLLQFWVECGLAKVCAAKRRKVLSARRQGDGRWLPGVAHVWRTFLHIPDICKQIKLANLTPKKIENTPRMPLKIYSFQMQNYAKCKIMQGATSCKCKIMQCAKLSKVQNYARCQIW